MQYVNANVYEACGDFSLFVLENGTFGSRSHQSLCRTIQSDVYANLIHRQIYMESH